MSDIPIVESLEAGDKRELFADKWYGSATERAEVSATLAKYDLDADAVAAHAFVVRQTQIQALETLIGRAELRRDRILREISFYRETLTEGLDPLTRKLIDARPMTFPSLLNRQWRSSHAIRTSASRQQEQRPP